MTEQIEVTQGFRPIPKLSASDVERFEGYRAECDGCWEWQGPFSGNATHKYGDITVSGKAYRAHRVAYALTHGSIPEGMVIDHLCRNTLCVNPAHLEAVTSTENTLRGRSYPTHCKRGHRLSGENVRLVGRQRKCRPCGRIRVQKWRAARNG